MNEEERVKLLEEQMEETRDDLKEILLDIRTYLMEATSPIPNDLGRDDIR